MALLGDLFPGIHVERSRNMTFEKIIEDRVIADKLYPDPDFIKKCVEY